MDFEETLKRQALISKTLDKCRNNLSIDKELCVGAYRMVREYKSLSNEMLFQEYSGTVKNILYLVDGLRDMCPKKCMFLSSAWWSVKLICLEEEFLLRSNDIPDGVKLFSLIPFVPDSLQWASEVEPILTPAFPNETAFLVRYLKKTYAKQAFYDGYFRINSASGMKKEENKARHDNEVQKTYRVTSGSSVTTSDGKLYPIQGEMRYYKSLYVDYYLLCFSNEYDHRLHTDFDTDYAIIIHDIGELYNRISVCLKKNFTFAHTTHIPIEYIDPIPLTYNTDVKQTPEKLPVGMMKNISYAYQREYRMVFCPEGEAVKGHIDTDIGCIKDIATLVDRNGMRIDGVGLA